MKVLLVTVHEEDSSWAFYSLGILRIQYFLQRNNIKCDIYDAGFESEEQYIQEAARGGYALIGFNSTYMYLERELPVVARFAEAVRGKSCILLAGGQVPSRACELWLSIGFDAVIAGYGEFPFLEMMQALQAAGKVDPSVIAGIPGVICRVDGKIVNTPPRMLTQKDFQFLNYDMIIEAGVYKAWDSPLSKVKNIQGEMSRSSQMESLQLFTSHNCPNRCGYCSSSNFLQQVYGKKSAEFSLNPEQVCDLLCLYYKQSGKTFFVFWDDDFTTPYSYTLEFCQRIIELKKIGKLPLSLKLSCYSRVMDFVDSKTKNIRIDMMLLMKEVGFTLFMFGVENFSKSLLHTKMMHKYGYDDSIVMSLLHTAKKIGLGFQINIMLFVPETTRHELLFNINRLIDIQLMNELVMLNVYILAYPGSTAFSDSCYSTHDVTLISPVNNKSYTKRKYFLPHDPQVAHALTAYLGGAVPEAMGEVRQRYGAAVDVHEPCLFNYIKCLVIARSLKDKTTVIRLENCIVERAQFLCSVS